MGSISDPKIPVVDFSKDECWVPGTSSWISAREEVCRALHEFSCLIAVLPDKISPELQATMFGKINELLDFSIEVKSQIPLDRPRLDGYVLGSFFESMVTGTDTEKSSKFEQHFWPNGNDQYRESVDHYTNVMKKLNQVVTRMVFENYNAEKYHDDHIQLTIPVLRFTKYMAPKDIPIGVDPPPHTDTTFTTILHQNNVSGLEINTKDNKWIGFPAAPSSFILLAGDCLQVWSNDKIKSCKHRVTLTEDKIRCSLGLFCHKDGVVTIPNELTDKDHPRQYKPCNTVDYINYHNDHFRTKGVVGSVKDFCGV